MYSTGPVLASGGCARARPTPRQTALKWGQALALAAILGAATGAGARGPESNVPVLHLASLPAQAQATHQLILAGGPFPHGKDGTVFGNRERQLPVKARGYYREYTVETPGSHDRGARRIICGGRPPTQPQACYYTSDHYASFSRIAQ